MRNNFKIYYSIDIIRYIKENNKTPTLVAEELGLSLNRIYQLANGSITEKTKNKLIHRLPEIANYIKPL